MERVWKIYCVNDREGKFPSNENYYIPFIGSYEEVIVEWYDYVQLPYVYGLKDK
jgi:hypothetical protein